MKKNMVLFLAIAGVSVCLLFIKIEYQSYIGSRLSLITAHVSMTKFFETGDIFIILISVIFLPEIIYEIFHNNFQNTERNRILFILLTVLYFYITELLVTVKYFRNISRIRDFLGIRKEMIPEEAVFSLLSPVNSFIMIMVLR